ncbi:MAG: hypothetical protein QM689_01970 [Oscillospiraceae bacterium]
MKIRSLLAVAAATVVAGATVAIPASADSTAYLQTVQASWSGSSPNDLIDSGAGDLNAWDSGNQWNGNWVQVLLTSDDLSNTSIEFTIDTSDATWQDAGEGEDAMTEWTVLRVGDTSDTSAYQLFAEDTTLGSYTYTMTSDMLTEALGNDKIKCPANEDGTYTLGFSIQIGHLANAKVTGVVTSDVLPATEETTSDTEVTSDTETTGDADTDSTTAEDDTATTGATTGLAFLGLAVAACAVVAAKRK